MERIVLRNAYLRRVDQLVAMRRYKEALVEAEEWLRQDPEDADALAALAYVCQFTDADKALYWSGETIRREPHHHLAWRVRLVVSYERADWKAFDEVSDEMLRMFPMEGYIYRLKAQQLLVRNKRKEALGLIRQAVALDHAAVSYAVYAYALALEGEFEQAREAERTALATDPEDVQTLLYAGWSADRRGDYKTASERMTLAVRLDPDNAQTREEYLNMLQKSLWFYRILLLPRFLRKLKPWQLLLVWLVCWALFRPLLLVFIVLYILSYWSSKWIVHVKVFGFRRAPKSKR